MATRQSQIVINVDDKSLTQLNNEIQELQSSIDGLVVGTEEWIRANEKMGDLKRQFQTATDGAEKLQGQIEKISGPQQLQAFAKLGAGMVGAFTVATQSLEAFGIQSEAFDEMTAKATSLMAVMGGLNAVAETFSTENIKGLKAIGGGFTKMVKSVKTASTAMRGALIASGIGAIAVAVGLIVANWDKLTKLLDRSSQKQTKAYEKNREELEKQLESLTDVNKAYEEQERLLDEISQFAKAYTPFQDIDEVIEKANLALEKQKDIAFAASLEAGRLANEAREDWLDIQSEIDRLTKKYGELSFAEGNANEGLLKQTLRQINSEKEKLKIQEDVANSRVDESIAAGIVLTNINRQIGLNEKYLDGRKKYAEENKNLLQTEQDRIKTLEDELIVLGSQQNKEKEIFESRLEILNIQIEQYTDLTDAGLTLTKTEEDILNTLKKQREALGLQNTERETGVKEANRLLELQRDLLDKTEAYLTTQISTEINNQIIINQLQEINNEEKKRGRFVDGQIESLKEAEKHYIEIDKAIKIQNKNYEFRVQKIKDERDFFISITRLENEKLDSELESLSTQKEVLEIQNKLLEAKIKESEESVNIIDDQITYQEALRKAAQTKEEELAIDQTIADLNQEKKAIELENLSIQNEILSNKGEIAEIEDEILKTTDEIVDNNKEVSDEIERTNELLAEQEKTWSKLQGLLGQYGEEIQLVQETLSQGFELAAAIFDRRAVIAQQTLDGLRDELSVLEEETSDLESDRLALEEELKDANGERYDELLLQINDIKDQEVEAIAAVEAKNQEIDEQDRARVDAEYKAAKWRKAQAIVDGIIQTALGVIKALPNIFLSVATGVLGAAGVATIAAQKLPPRPEQDGPLPSRSGSGFLDGGYTGDIDVNKVAGVVHGKEYVVPAKVVRSSSGRSHIAALEKQRTRGYANGGYVAPVTQGPDSGIDYDKFSTMLAQAVSQLPNPQVGLVDISNGIREVELTKQNSGLNR